MHVDLLVNDNKCCSFVKVNQLSLRFTRSIWTLSRLRQNEKLIPIRKSYFHLIGVVWVWKSDMDQKTILCNYSCKRMWAVLLPVCTCPCPGSVQWWLKLHELNRVSWGCVVWRSSGTVVLNVGLNRMLVKVPQLSRCWRMKCRPTLTVSSTDPLAWYANCMGSVRGSVMAFR